MMHFFFRQPVHPVWLPVLRLGTGGLLALGMLAMWTDVEALYGLDSLVPQALQALRKQGIGPSVHDIATMVAGILGLPHRICLTLLASVYVGMSILLAIGWHGRIVATGLLVFHVSWHIVQPNWSYGFDYLACSVLFYCCWFPAGPGVWHNAKPTPNTTPYLRVLQLHLCIIYFFGGLGKLLGPTWRNGEALWKALAQPYHTDGHSWQHALGAFPALWTAMGLLVIFLEICYPLAMWQPRLRHLWLRGILAMHLGIALFMGLYLFSAFMALLNLAAFHYPYIVPSRQIKPNHSNILATVGNGRKPPPTASGDTTKGGGVMDDC